MSRLRHLVCLQGTFRN